MLLAARGEVIVFGAGLAVVGFAWSLGMVSTSMALASIPLPWRLRVQGRGDLSLNVAGGAASVLAGLVVAWRGYEPLVILVGAALVVVAGFVAFLGAERRRRRPRAARDSPEVVAAAPER
jgi:predicted MFS family arabinose efflux permease